MLPIVTTHFKLLETQFKCKLDTHARMFKRIRSGTTESPRWFQYRGVKRDLDQVQEAHPDLVQLPNFLTFISSQDPARYFHLNISDFSTDAKRQIALTDYSEIYEYWKNVKYKFLAEYHPTI